MDGRDYSTAYAPRTILPRTAAAPIARGRATESCDALRVIYQDVEQWAWAVRMTYALGVTTSCTSLTMLVAAGPRKLVASPKRLVAKRTDVIVSLGSSGDGLNTIPSATRAIPRTRTIHIDIRIAWIKTRDGTHQYRIQLHCRLVGITGMSVGLHALSGEYYSLSDVASWNTDATVYGSLTYATIRLQTNTVSTNLLAWLRSRWIRLKCLSVSDVGHLSLDKTYG